MIFVLVALWGVSLLLLILNPKNRSVRWLSAVSFCGGSGALAAVLGDEVLPRWSMEHPSADAVKYFRLIMKGASIVSYYGLPYTFLMFAAHYHPVPLFMRWKKGWPWLLLFPAMAMFCFTPVYTVDHPYLYKWLALWALPYFALGSVLMLTKKEYNPVWLRTHRLTCLAVLTPVLFCAVMNYLLPSFGYYEMWRYNTWIIVFAFTVFVFSLFSYGFLGMQLLIRRMQLDTTLRAITSGTAILNHAIKNDIGKMRLFGEKIRQYAQKTEQPELLEDIQVIMRAANHIQEMIHRVQDQTQDTVLKLKRLDIRPLLDEAIQAIRPHASNIEIVTHYDEVPPIVGDRSHLAEVFHNILMNAMEAMPHGGTLIVSTYLNKKRVTVEFRDSGIGMEKKHLKKVMEPFYTTKGSRNNFGLGLAYCYNMMNKHQGSIELKSEPGRGTTVFLYFPKPKSEKRGLE